MVRTIAGGEAKGELRSETADGDVQVTFWLEMFKVDSSFGALLLAEMRAATAQQLETVGVVWDSEHLAAV